MTKITHREIADWFSRVHIIKLIITHSVIPVVNEYYYSMLGIAGYDSNAQGVELALGIHEPLIYLNFINDHTASNKLALLREPHRNFFIITNKNKVTKDISFFKLDDGSIEYIDADYTNARYILTGCSFVNNEPCVLSKISENHRRLEL